MSDSAELICPHCGKPLVLVDGRLQVAAAPSEKARAEEAGSIWDRKREPSMPSRPAAGAARAASAFATRTEERATAGADLPWLRRKTDAAPATPARSVPSFGRAEPVSQAAAFGRAAAEVASPARSEAAPETARPAVVTRPAETFSRPSPSRAADPAPAPAPAPKPAVAVAPAAAPARPAPEPRPAVAPGAGPTLLDALETDPALNEGQRETIRLVYKRFAPQATRTAHATPDLTVRAVIDKDPYLGRGQVATIMMLYDRFVPRT